MCRATVRSGTGQMGSIPHGAPGRRASLAASQAGQRRQCIRPFCDPIRRHSDPEEIRMGHRRTEWKRPTNGHLSAVGHVLQRSCTGPADRAWTTSASATCFSRGCYDGAKSCSGTCCRPGIPPNSPALLVHKEVAPIGSRRPNVPLAEHDSPSRHHQRHGRHQTATGNALAATAQQGIRRACPKLADIFRIEQEADSETGSPKERAQCLESDHSSGFATQSGPAFRL